MNNVRSNNLSLKYQRFTPSGCKNKEIRKCEFVAKTQLLWKSILTKIVPKMAVWENFKANIVARKWAQSALKSWQKNRSLSFEDLLNHISKF